MTGIRGFVRHWWPALFSTLALCLSVAALKAVGPLVADGREARALQVQVAPASCKRGVANYRERVWSLRDLEMATMPLPGRCLAAERILVDAGRIAPVPPIKPRR